MNDRKNYFMINLHGSMGPAQDRTRDPWMGVLRFKACSPSLLSGWCVYPYFTAVGPLLFGPGCPVGPLWAADPREPARLLPVLFGLALGDPGWPMVMCPLGLSVHWVALLRGRLVCSSCDVLWGGVSFPNCL